MKRTILAIVIVATGLIPARADEPLQTARVVAIKDHPQGRITSWEGRVPIFDNYPVYDITLDWKGKKFVVRYESSSGYYPKVWESGKDIRVKRERGRFLLYRGDEPIPAREISPNDCVPVSSPLPGSIMPQIPCE